MHKLTIIAAATLFATPVLAGGHASGDAAAGEEVFKKCQTCHQIQDADGNSLAGRGRTGPNLWGLPGRAVASEDFRYGDSILKVGESGVVWNEEEFVAYVQDPSAWLGDKLGERGRSKMSFQLRGGSAAEDAANVWAYIASLSPEPES